MQTMSPSNRAVKNNLLNMWFFQNGAGWPSVRDAVPGSPAYPCPWIFRSLRQLLYFNRTAPIYSYTRPYFMPSIYSLNGIPSSEAVCVVTPFLFMYFYLAPNYFAQCNSILLSKFNIMPPPGTGPVITAEQARLFGAAYVLIAKGGPTGPSFFGVGPKGSVGTLIS